VSGINDSTVFATVTDPAGLRTEIPMVYDNKGHYVAYYITTIDSAVGIYNVTVYAKDNTGNSNIGNGFLDITYGYSVRLKVEPKSVYIGENVVMSGSVRFDNDSLVPETSLTLNTPNSVTVNIDPSTGGFTYTKSYPNAGTYEITAAITAENGFTFSDSDSVTVKTRRRGGGGGGGGGYVITSENATTVYRECGDGTKDAGENCETCPADAPCGEDEACNAGVCEKKKVKEEDNKCGNGVCDERETCISDSCCNGLSVDFNSDLLNCGSCGKECAVGEICSEGKCIKTAECNKDSDCGKGRQCNNGKCVGQKRGLIGSAVGFLNLKMIRSNLFWWILLMALIVLFIIVYIRNRSLPVTEPSSSEFFQRNIAFPKKKDTIGLNKYLERRAKK
ncbi:MAG: hypothetical protein N3D84_00175, partial [Candidatus Woesearchaeota archaeon]|nr:hypothetical protein [Candidatus Woesearchaeota archaeon]